MNKLIQVTISGVLFQIEEAAYDKLRHYLDSIRRHFGNNEGSREILEDIEARIAELFSSKTEAKGYVSEADVEEVITMMGKPSDMGEGEGEPSATSGSQQQETRKRLFRDPDDRVAGGVCAGIGAYFDIDPVWIRLAFAFSFFVFGTGLLLYIVLWMIIPEARTASEKLQMRGSRIDINNIEKTVREEMNRVQQRVQDFSKSDRFKQTTENIADGASRVAKGFIQVLEKFLAVFFVGGALVLLVSFVMGYFNLFNRYSFLPFSRYVRMIYVSETDHMLVIAGITLLVCIPLLAIIIKGVMIIGGGGKTPRYLRHVFGYLWALALVVIVVMAVRTAGYFSVDATKREKTALPASDTLRLFREPVADEEYQVKANFMGMTINGKNPFYIRPHLHIYSSSAKPGELEVLKSASGSDDEDAKANAAAISRFWRTENGDIYIDDRKPMGKDMLWRNQQLKINIHIPVGKIVVIDRQLQDILYYGDRYIDLDELAGHTCIMTEKGLMTMHEYELYKEGKHDQDTHVY